MTVFRDAEALLDALRDLGALLEQRGERFTLCVIGGGAFMLQEPERMHATGDLDVSGQVLEDGTVVAPAPLPATLATAIADIARDRGLGPGWVNSAAAAAFGVLLPDGFFTRAKTIDLRGLVLLVADREDLLKLKLQAAQRRGAPGARQLDDVVRARPTDIELERAAEYVRSQSTDARATEDRLVDTLATIRARLDA